MKTLYLDLSSGISGDMMVGALIDLGVDVAIIEAALAPLEVGHYHLHAAKAVKSGIQGTKFDVHLESEEGDAHNPPRPGPERGEPAAPQAHAHPRGHHHHSHPEAGNRPEEPPAELLPDAVDHRHDHPHEGARDFAEIRDLISGSDLDEWVKRRALGVFTRLAEAEGKVHGVPPDRVHFHEVGAVDSIVDIVGACVALNELGRPRILASTVTDGSGFAPCAHGRLPVPVPATLGLLAARGIPFAQCEEPGELVTPTGAALLAEFAESFGPMPVLRPERIGYGLGTRTLRTRPNALRALLGECDEGSGSDEWEMDQVAVLETNLDDVSPEVLGNFLETALAAGALDVFHTAVQMKKSRPGVVLTVLCEAGRADEFTRRLLRETSAFGVRRTVADRRKLRREFDEVETPFGRVRVKLGFLGEWMVQAAPEFESARAAAAAAGVGVREVLSAAAAACESRKSR
ncbi:MAG: nickel pincer cofactor biosynthesis protein LarC [Verrucomicrobiales bacterium]|nr:nickel pincer cofactor biosynthesis protein LarC [Verrucomicrobiales bacterium]